MLIAAAVLIWVAVLAGTYLRVFEMRKWFVNLPSSLEKIRQQSTRSRLFWIPLSILFILSVCSALVIYWNTSSIRYYLLAAVLCYAITGTVRSPYIFRGVIRSAKAQVQKVSNLELQQRISLWARWTAFRDILQFLAAIFITIALLNSIPIESLI